MRTWLILFSLFSLPARAAVLGVAGGTFAATGTLESGSALVPDLEFHSVRRLTAGVIEATTTASLLGADMATAKARLRVVFHGANDFELLDLDAGSAPAGNGHCAADGCTFTVTVMGGDLTLTETWAPTPTGFRLTNGSQVFHGIPATYHAEFSRQ